MGETRLSYVLYDEKRFLGKQMGYFPKYGTEFFVDETPLRRDPNIQNHTYQWSSTHPNQLPCFEIVEKFGIFYKCFGQPLSSYLNNLKSQKEPINPVMYMDIPYPPPFPAPRPSLVAYIPDEYRSIFRQIISYVDDLHRKGRFTTTGLSLENMGMDNNSTVLIYGVGARNEVRKNLRRKKRQQDLKNVHQIIKNIIGLQWSNLPADMSNFMELVLDPATRNLKDHVALMSSKARVYLLEQLDQQHTGKTRFVYNLVMRPIQCQNWRSLIKPEFGPIIECLNHEGNNYDDSWFSFFRFLRNAAVHLKSVRNPRIECDARLIDALLLNMFWEHIFSIHENIYGKWIGKKSNTLMSLVTM